MRQNERRQDERRQDERRQDERRHDGLNWRQNSIIGREREELMQIESKDVEGDGEFHFCSREYSKLRNSMMN